MSGVGGGFTQWEPRGKEVAGGGPPRGQTVRVSLTMTWEVRIRPIWDLKESVWPPVEKIHELFLFLLKKLFDSISIFLRLAATFQNQTEGRKKIPQELLRAVSAEAPATLIVLIRCQFLLH